MMEGTLHTDPINHNGRRGVVESPKLVIFLFTTREAAPSE